MGSLPTIVIDRKEAESAYEQIAGQIRTFVATGGLPSGTPLPSVRALAADLGVNLNTVARAYRVLADQGFVRIRDRSGVVVAAPAPSPAPGAGVGFKAELGALLARMRQAGVPANHVRRMVDRELDRTSNPRRESEN